MVARTLISALCAITANRWHTHQVDNFRKLPLLLRIVLVGFVLAPLGNFAATFSAIGIPQWYMPGKFFELAAQVTLFDWFWNLLILLSGLLLLLRRKLAWAISVASIAVALAANFHHWYYGAIENLNSQFYLFSTSGCLAILAILFYFRHPHLDRRDRWFSMNVRYKVEVKVPITRPFATEGVIVNISSGGALIDISEKVVGQFSVDGPLSFKLPSAKEVHGRVVRITHNSVAVHFDVYLKAEDLKV